MTVPWYWEWYQKTGQYVWKGDSMIESQSPGGLYVPNYNFEVQLGLTIKVNFSKISNLSFNREYDVITDGGNGDSMRFVEKPKRKPDTLILSKGLTSDAGSSILSWLVAGVRIYDIMILVTCEGVARKIFYIEQGILTNISFSDLDAMRNEIIIKKMELQHTGIVEIPV